MFRLLCIEYKMTTPEYFLDKMQPYELDLFLDNMNYAYRYSWEQARFISYILSLPNVDRKKYPNFSMNDIQEFPWDKDEDEIEPLTDKDIENFKNMQKRTYSFEDIE